MGSALMNILGVLAGALGGLILMAAQSAIHQIQAFILFLIAAVFFVGGGIVKAVNVAEALPDKPDLSPRAQFEPLSDKDFKSKE